MRRALAGVAMLMASACLEPVQSMNAPSDGGAVGVPSDGGAAVDAGAPVCTVGDSTSCNKDPGVVPKGRCISGIAGNLCQCNDGFSLDSATGRCF